MGGLRYEGMFQFLSMNREVKLEASWREVLGDEFDLDYMLQLRAFLRDERAARKTIYPKYSQYFSALNLTPFDQVKVVILGQDPYHGAGQAHGLCFSVAPDVRIPPSLANIYKELNYDLAIDTPNHGCLLSWAKQGVLLLNSVLSVEAGKAGSHQNQGWELFTNKLIEHINAKREHVVFILWGNYAQKKGVFIDADRHLVLKGVHPSPLSAHRGFFGQHYFSRTNSYLQQYGKRAVDWSLPDRDEVMLQFMQGT